MQSHPPKGYINFQHGYMSGLDRRDWLQTGDMTVDQIRMRLAELELQEASKPLDAPTKPLSSPPALADLRRAPHIASITFPSSLDCALQAGVIQKPVRSMPWLLAWSRAWLQ